MAMKNAHYNEHDFLIKITSFIEENISNEQFGVSELAQKAGMSRSNLLRKVKKLTNSSVSQLIRQVRLRLAMDILSETSMNVSEVSYKVGFSSTSYFIKCFREYYGYPPGEVGKYDANKDVSVHIDQGERSHQLVAIMFTDIEGYTSLMQKDEQQAIEIRNRHREVFEAITKKYKGRILQYYGDGTLSTFHSAIDAVRCGIELQLAFGLKPEVPVRIGIHSGDILISKEDIIGDGVNVASRIESLAVAGSVFISDKVYDEVKNQSGIQAVSLGEFELKNVGKPKEVFAISNPGLKVPQWEEMRGKEKVPIPKIKLETRSKRSWKQIKWVMIILAALTVGYFISKIEIFGLVTPPNDYTDLDLSKKSIAVLPFINDSNDSTNLYIINGLMESILNNLQKIKELRVISRTSIEKYRNSTKMIPEIAKELNVHYLVGGSGQKIGDQILLNIQLIEARSDKQLWNKQFNRDANDIFKLQIEIAKNIADQIQIIITPEEERQIEKIPTNNLVAYDYFLKGRELYFIGSKESLEEAIVYYNKAIELDSEFAQAYAGLAIVYFFLDYYQTGKMYSDKINNNADKALLYDAELPQSLIAKALFYIHNSEYELAIPHLEKALEYNPNSSLVINILSDFYTRFVPNTEKYLEYALQGIRIDIEATDSASTSMTYMHLSNAFVQSGFVEEAEFYINKSLDYDPQNLYSPYLKAYVLYAKNNDLQETKDLLLKALNVDTTRMDILQEVGKICYFMRNYEEAYFYYRKFLNIKEAQNLDIYHVENSKIGMVMSKMGKEQDARKYFRMFEDYTQYDQSIYKEINQAMVQVIKGDYDKAIEFLQMFSLNKNYHYWIVLFFDLDPIMDPIRDNPAYKQILNTIESNFWTNHERIKTGLNEKGLISSQ